MVVFLEREKGRDGERERGKERGRERGEERVRGRGKVRERRRRERIILAIYVLSFKLVT